MGERDLPTARLGRVLLVFICMALVGPTAPVLAGPSPAVEAVDAVDAVEPNSELTLSATRDAWVNKQQPDRNYGSAACQGVRPGRG